MPPFPPPSGVRASPSPLALPAGSRLWRVHHKHRPGSAFKPAEPNRHFRGGRFDGTRDDSYPCLYASPQEQTALLETLARGLHFNDSGERLIRRAAITGYRISEFETTKDLTLISLLTTADLAAACQDEWLINCQAADYSQTRRWGQWLRSQASWPQGLVWPSSRNLGGWNLVLFGDRCPDAALQIVAGTEVDFDDDDGARWLNGQLAPFRISVRLRTVVRAAR